MRGAVAFLLAGTGGALAPAAAQAATPAVAASACSTDTGAKGLAGGPVAGSLVQVPRSDGRVDQLQLFYDPSAMGGLPFVWHREQAAPGEAYGPWTRVSAATVGPKSYYLTAIENSAGQVEILFSTYGQFCHSVRNADGPGWSEPDNFGLAPGPYMGGVVLFQERDGTIDAFAASMKTGSSMEVRSQYDAGAGWGPVTSMGQVPETGIGLSQPSTISQLPDGRVHLTVHEWNRETRYWQITQDSPGGPWGPWQLCGTVCE